MEQEQSNPVGETSRSTSSPTSSSTSSTVSNLSSLSTISGVSETNVQLNDPESSGQSVQECKKAHVYKRKKVLKYFKDELRPFEQIEIQNFHQIYYFAPGVDKQMEEEELTFFDDGHYVVIPNDHLCYRYQMLNVLGKGSYGVVVKAYDHKNLEHVAIKIHRVGRDFENAAHREGEFLKYLLQKNHQGPKNIIRFYEYFTFRHHHCMTFELLDSDLASLLSNYPFGLDKNFVRAAVREILLGLDFMHNHGVIHADIKPQNIGIKKVGETLQFKVSKEIM